MLPGGCFAAALSPKPRTHVKKRRQNTRAEIRNPVQPKAGGKGFIKAGQRKSSF